MDSDDILRGFRMRSFLLTSVLAFCALNSAAAQAPNNNLGIGNPGSSVPGVQEQKPGVAAPHQPNQADRVFLINGALGNAAEVDLAKLAVQKSQDNSVKTFARRMVQDHSDAKRQLSNLAEVDHVQLGLPDPDHQQVHDGLAKLSGAE